MKIFRCVALGAALALTAPAFSQSGHSQHGDKSGGSHEMMQSMMQGMNEMNGMKMSGDVDRDFAQMMKKHHEMGVKMAQMETERGIDAKMKQMARKIIEQQRREIGEFDEYLKSGK